MSPEQVLGRPVDHRADIFALGAVLYEMFTGYRAFQRPSNVQTMTAVLQEDPWTRSHSTPSCRRPRPRSCGGASRRTRRTDSNRPATWRSICNSFASSAAGQAALAAPSGFRRKLLPALLAVAVLIEGIALARLLLRPAPVPAFEQLTFRRGRIGGARFASEGQAVVYSQTREGPASEVSRLDLADSPASRSLDYPAGSDVLAARAGELALSLRRRFLIGERFVGTLALAPLGGGSPREVTENVEDADWDPSESNSPWPVRPATSAAKLDRVRRPNAL